MNKSADVTFNFSQTKYELFVCFADEDRDMQADLESALRRLQKQDVVSSWYNRPVAGQAERKSVADDALEKSKIILFLLSPDFVASKYSGDAEVQKALGRHRSGEARAAAVILRPVAMEGTPFSDLLPSLPTDGRAVSQWPSRQEAFADVARSIGELVHELRREELLETAPLPPRAPSSEQPSDLQDSSRPSPSSDTWKTSGPVKPSDTGKTSAPAKSSSTGKKSAPSSGSSVRSKSTDHPDKIGRYVVTRVLGKGAFGKVYLAHDGELDRDVAIKTPHRERISRPEDGEAYMNEARMVAQLDHPGIVPVYDVGRTDGMCFVVSKLIKGSDLAKKIKDTPPSHYDAAETVAQIADALYYAHKREVVHRDIKPANILIDEEGTPYVADFGLALREEDFGKASRHAGTPAYMSPEQARGEGHRVDGRSDIFSLGVVLYELLTGRRPFRSKNLSDLLDEISSSEARPPRQVDDSINRELERICLKAMSNRIKDRYTNARDLAEDLRYFLATEGQGGSGASGRNVADGRPSSASREASPSTHGSGSQVPSSARSNRASSTLQAAASTVNEQLPAKVIAKGLRSFDRTDASFFLQLLPGPRDRDGLPESIRFWKRLIDEPSPDNTFSVGVVYGPSGCGKTSFLRAGLLPRLSPSVASLVVEASRDNTEQDVLKRLQRCCRELRSVNSLPDAMTAIRRGQVRPPGDKVLIVVDQFEQWLHARGDNHAADLVNAVRQCEGGRLQCLLSVRADFSLGTYRFMQQVEVPIQEGVNSATVDLFDPTHARRVLADFGRSYRCLPDNPDEMTAQQETFLDRAISELQEDGKIIPVKLVLFAEMVKGRTWSDKTLRELGGTTGLGVRFLEDTFSGETAPLEHRVHGKAVRPVLKSLLPEAGSDLKGGGKSYDELLELSGYANRPGDFPALMQILDGDLRLITPKEESRADSQESRADSAADQALALDPQPSTLNSSYRLTHDYLVPPLREWLTRKQKETRRGRAQLRLDDRSALWNDKPENRRLPSLWEFLNIKALTQKSRWTDAQQKMMRRAGRYHAIRGFVIVTLMAIAGVAALMVVANRNEQLRRLAEGVLAADIDNVTRRIDALGDENAAVQPNFRQALAEADPQRRLRASLALLPTDPTQVEFLREQMLVAEPREFRVLQQALAPHKYKISEQLWPHLTADANREFKGKLFRAACALAQYDSANERWNQVSDRVAAELVAMPSSLTHWKDYLVQVRNVLAAPLAAIYRDPQRSENERGVAAEVLVDYASDQPDELVGLLADAINKNQFDGFLDKLKLYGDDAIERLESTLEPPTAVEAADDEKEKLALQQTNIAVALVRLGKPDKAWEKLKQSADPRLRFYLLDRLGPFGAEPTVIVERLLAWNELPAGQQDVSIRRALIQSLGEFDQQQLQTDELKPRVTDLTETLKRWYREDPDAGIHGACEWLLGAWIGADEVRQLKEGLTETEQQLRARPADNNRKWYVNGQSQTMVVIDGPVEFVMGSPPTEVGREDGANGTVENRHTRRIGRSYAIASTEVTRSQFDVFLKELGQEFAVPEEFSPHRDGPQIGVTFYVAAQYCNWLSEKEGIPDGQWCYQANQSGNYAEGMQAVADYQNRHGYRLPTEAEWEFACRANTITSRFFGESENLLRKYAWYYANSGSTAHVVATRKPNSFGLFDTYGNVAEWCQNNFVTFEIGTTVDDEKVPSYPDVTNVDYIMIRGGAFSYLPNLNRSAARGDRLPPFNDQPQLGFRVARTLAAQAD